MKVITYEEWLRNPTPRMMWVWDVNEKDKVQRKVVYILRENYVPNKVITVDNDDSGYEFYRHCAEIEKQRRMTEKELSRWLREKHTREYKLKGSDFIYCEKNYREIEQSDEVDSRILIREDDGDWKEPLVEA